MEIISQGRGLRLVVSLREGELLIELGPVLFFTCEDAWMMCIHDCSNHLDLSQVRRLCYYGAVREGDAELASKKKVWSTGCRIDAYPL
jgi:hypothetical protein